MSTSVAKGTKKDTKAEVPSALRGWVDSVAIQMDLEREESPFNVQDLYASMLEADSFEQLLELQEGSALPSSKDLTGQPHIVNSFTIRASDKSAALPFYVVVDGQDLETGQPLVYGTRAPNVIIVLWQAEKWGRLPGPFIITSKEAANGSVLFLKPYKTTVVQG